MDLFRINARKNQEIYLKSNLDKIELEYEKTLKSIIGSDDYINLSVQASITIEKAREKIFRDSMIIYNHIY